MTVFFDGVPRIVVQGATGREARMVLRHTLAYGTAIAAGVTPGRGGDEAEGVPIFSSVARAAEATGGAFDAALVSVPPLAVLDAGSEALEARVPFLVVATENVPQHDAVRLVALVHEAGATLIGPNSVGVIAPALRLKLGAIGGDNPDRVFLPGRIGIISRSGGLTAEVALQLAVAGLGVSVAVSIGGDAIIGTTPAALVRQFAADDDTDAIVYVGEPGTTLEQRLAEALEEVEPRKPLVALVLGHFMEEFPHGTVFGHAGAVITGTQGLPSEKERRLRDAGALVATSFDDVLQLLRGSLQGCTEQ